MSDKKTPMTPSDASRIQSEADKTGTNQDFKGRAQGAGARNAGTDRSGGGGGGSDKGGGDKGGGDKGGAQKK